MTKPVDPQTVSDLGVLARVTTLEGLAEVFRARRQSLGLSQMDLEQIAGLAGGHVGKLEKVVYAPGDKKDAKGLGKVTIPLLLDALGLELLVVPRMLQPQKHPGSYAGASTCSLTSKNFWRQRTLKARTLAAQKMTPKQKRERARAAARARWGKRAPGQRPAFEAVDGRSKAAEDLKGSSTPST